MRFVVLGAERVMRALSAYDGRVVRGGLEGRMSAREAARRGGLSYVIVPTIRHWEERATQWTGLPDQIWIDIAVYEAQLGARLDSVEIHGKSRWFTLGGDRAEHLLDEPIRDYVATLLAVPH